MNSYLSGTEKNLLDTLGSDNGAPSGNAYWDQLKGPFGLQLPTPFRLRAGIGSHLFRLSGPRFETYFS